MTFSSHQNARMSTDGATFEWAMGRRFESSVSSNPTTTQEYDWCQILILNCYMVLCQAVVAVTSEPNGSILQISNIYSITTEQSEFHLLEARLLQSQCCNQQLQNLPCRQQPRIASHQQQRLEKCLNLGLRLQSITSQIGTSTTSSAVKQVLLC